MQVSPNPYEDESFHVPPELEEPFEELYDEGGPYADEPPEGDYYGDDGWDDRFDQDEGLPDLE